ncbi:MAG TPA: EVE domain-containing protein [Vicinamibacterales bacterium]|nr:EVE domain-containing protein [Vicinamibacterales bacterium]
MTDGATTWLFKEEPTHYGYDALERDRRTTWTGVKNPLAQKYLARVRKGDRILYYHTGKEKAIVGIATAVSDAYPDPDGAAKGFVVDVAPRRRLDRPLTLAEIKARPAFAEFALVRMPRLSVMPVPERELQELQDLAPGAGLDA